MINTNYYAPRPTYPQNPFQQIFVTGIEGARAYQLPAGVFAAVLWDSEKDVFYLKQIDQMGRPFIAKVCSYADCEIPDPTTASANSAPSIDTSNFVTKDYFDQVISRLSVGERGRIVIDESNE